MHATNLTQLADRMGDRDDLPEFGDWAGWVQKQMTIRGWNNTVLGEHAGLDRSIIGHWINTGRKPDQNSIRKICKAFGLSVKLGVVAAGMFTAEEMELDVPPADITAFTDHQVLADVARRMSRRRALVAEGFGPLPAELTRAHSPEVSTDCGPHDGAQTAIRRAVAAS